MTTLLLLACSSSTPTPEAAAPPPPASAPAPAAKGAPQPLPPPMERSPQDPECMIQEAMTPHLAEDQGGARLTREGAVGWGQESFTRADGTQVRYQQGGCVHYGMTMTVALNQVPADPYAEAVKQLGEIEYADNGDDLYTFLKSAGSIDEQGWFDCGDATCSVRVEQEGGGVQLIVSYDFPL